MGTLLQDIKYGVRVLAKNPGYAAAAIIVLALGIGANSAIFSVVNTVLLRPLPYQDASRIVQVWHVPPQASFPGMKTFSVCPANYLDWRAQNDVFDSMAAYHFRGAVMTGRNQPEVVNAARVPAEFFTVLRTRATAGRTFSADEEQAGHDKVVILSYGFWKDHFGTKEGTLGQKLTLDGDSYTVIGVMPKSFNEPDWAKVWVPLVWADKDRANRSNHNYEVIARLKDGVSLKQAQAEMDTISARLAQQYPADDKGWGAVLIPLREELTGDVRPALLMLLGAVAFVLLIACANVANLALAKTVGRKKEMAIRAALGASRGRVTRQVLTESLILGLAGGVAGLMLAQFGIELIVKFLGDQLPKGTEILLDGWVLAFTLALSLLAGIAAGLLPSLRASKTDLNDALKQGMGHTDAGVGGTRIRNVLVVCEVALSLVLLAGAGLLIRSLWLLRGVDPGFDAHNVLTMSLAIPKAKYKDSAAMNRYLQQAMERVRALPGVQAAGVVSDLPLTGSGDNWPIAIEGRPAKSLADQPEVEADVISAGYLSALRVRLIAGRNVTEADTADSPRAAVISEAMARHFWPNENPIGRRLTTGPFPEKPWEIVGVVRNVKHGGLDNTRPDETLYLPMAQIPETGGGVSLAVRTASQPAAMLSAISDAIHQVDADQPVTDVATMEEIVNTSLAPQRFNMLLLGAFAGLALILASVGIYSVLSYAVRTRVHEIGIRMALGARPGDVLCMIVSEGMKPALLGVGIGLATAVWMGQLLTKMVFGVKPADPLTFAAVALLLAAVALAASVIPAYRATKVEPMKALREE